MTDQTQPNQTEVIIDLLETIQEQDELIKIQQEVIIALLDTITSDNKIPRQTARLMKTIAKRTGLKITRLQSKLKRGDR